MKKGLEYKETHQQGFMEITRALPRSMKKGDFGIQISRDGRVWICFNGKSIIRFNPTPS